MAKIEPKGLVGTITGKLDSNVVTRVKKYRDPITGKIIGYGPNEYYVIHHNKPFPNTYSQRKARQRLMDANKIANEILCNNKHPRFSELYQAFLEQIHSENPK